MAVFSFLQPAALQGGKMAAERKGGVWGWDRGPREMGGGIAGSWIAWERGVIVQ